MKGVQIVLISVVLAGLVGSVVSSPLNLLKGLLGNDNIEEEQLKEANAEKLLEHQQNVMAERQMLDEAILKSVLQKEIEQKQIAALKAALEQNLQKKFQRKQTAEKIANLLASANAKESKD